MYKVQKIATSWRYRRSKLEDGMDLYMAEIGVLSLLIEDRIAIRFEYSLPLFCQIKGGNWPVKISGRRYVRYHIDWRMATLKNRKEMLLLIEEIAKRMGVL